METTYLIIIYLEYSFNLLISESESFCESRFKEGEKRIGK